MWLPKEKHMLIIYLIIYQSMIIHLGWRWLFIIQEVIQMMDTIIHTDLSIIFGMNLMINRFLDVPLIRWRKSWMKKFKILQQIYWYITNWIKGTCSMKFWPLILNFSMGFLNNCVKSFFNCYRLGIRIPIINMSFFIICHG